MIRKANIISLSSWLTYGYYGSKSRIGKVSAIRPAAWSSLSLYSTSWNRVLFTQNQFYSLFRTPTLEL